MTSPRVLTVLALVAAAALFSTGGAVAGSLVTGAQIKDGTVTSKDVKDRSLLAKDLSRATAESFSRPGARGATGATGATGPRGAAGAPGLVRAYGRVQGDGSLTQASAGVTVTHPGAGTYCITVAGVDPDTTVAVVTPDFQLDGTGTGTDNSQAFAEFSGTSADCPDGAVAVRTFLRTYTTTSGDLSSTRLDSEDQAFTFLVP